MVKLLKEFKPADFCGTETFGAYSISGGGDSLIDVRWNDGITRNMSFGKVWFYDNHAILGHNEKGWTILPSNPMQVFRACIYDEVSPILLGGKYFKVHHHDDSNNKTCFIVSSEDGSKTRETQWYNFKEIHDGFAIIEWMQGRYNIAPLFGESAYCLLKDSYRDIGYVTHGVFKLRNEDGYYQAYRSGQQLSPLRNRYNDIRSIPGSDQLFIGVNEENSFWDIIKIYDLNNILYNSSTQPIINGKEITLTCLDEKGVNDVTTIINLSGTILNNVKIYSIRRKNAKCVEVPRDSVEEEIPEEQEELVSAFIILTSNKIKTSNQYNYECIRRDEPKIPKIKNLDETIICWLIQNKGELIYTINDIPFSPQYWQHKLSIKKFDVSILANVPKKSLNKFIWLEKPISKENVISSIIARYAKKNEKEQTKKEEATQTTEPISKPSENTSTGNNLLARIQKLSNSLREQGYELDAIVKALPLLIPDFENVEVLPLVTMNYRYTSEEIENKYKNIENKLESIREASLNNLTALSLELQNEIVELKRLKEELYKNVISDALEIPASEASVEKTEESQPITKPSFKGGDLWLKRFNKLKSTKNMVLMQEARVEIFEDTVSYVTTQLRNTISELCQNTKFYKEEIRISPNANQGQATEIYVARWDSIETGKTLINMGLNPVVHIMANSITPGGGVRYGGNGQGESIFRRTNIYPALYQYHEYADLYNIERNKENSYPMDPDYGGIYIPNCDVIRDVENNGYRILEEPYKLSFIAVAALNSPQLDGNDYILPKYVERIKNKMRTVLRIGIENNHDAIVLGAMGCGNFNNPPHHIALIFKEVLNEQEFANRYKKIFFAIMEDENVKGGSFDAFEEVFG